MELNYFGTSLTEHGHYFWVLHDDRMENRWMDGFKTLPFNPEEMVKNPLKGYAQFFLIEGYSIWYIEGSCKDTRGGTKSVFWVKAEITPEELKQFILSHPMASRLISKMPFTVLW